MKATRYAAVLLACLAFAAGAFAQGGQTTPENPRWNSTPNDINNLLKSLKDLVGANYQMDIKKLEEINPDPEHNPILYYTGHYNFAFPDMARRMFREYMLRGGMMIFNTGLGSAPFYRSAKNELALIFPEVQLQRLSSDHPLFHCYYDMDRVEYSPGVRKAGFTGSEPWVDGITINCRTVAIISRFGLAVGWDGGEVLPEYAAYMPDSALKMGVNMISYATAMRAWSKQAASQVKFVDTDTSSTDKMNLAQVIYDGEWKTRHAGMSILLQTFNRKTEIPVKFGIKEMKLSNPKIFDAPLLYITGHENFRLSKDEAIRLREYVLSGGFLFAEACCGRKGFDLAFRQQMRNILREYPLVDIPSGHPIFLVPNNVMKLGVTPALAGQTGAVVAPRLQGIEIDGHYGVIYSPFGLAGGWEMTQSPYAHGYDTPSALLLGQNILMYAITQ